MLLPSANVSARARPPSALSRRKRAPPVAPLAAWRPGEPCRETLACVLARAGRGVASVSLALLLALSRLAPLTPPAHAFRGDVAPSQRAESAPPASRLSPEEERTVTLFGEATPSVVYVTTLRVERDLLTLDETTLPLGTGSGVVWSPDGYIVTNLHVVAGAQRVRVTLGDGRTFDANVVGFDEDKDVAVLKVDVRSGPALRPMPLGSSSSLRVGQRVFAIGNPFGLDHTLTTGVVSGLGREIQSGITGRPIRGVIQTDASINPGNSGGCLLDSSGRLIGINTAIYSPSGTSAGIGFAIPIDTVRGLVDQLIATGRVTRPVLGIVLAPDGAAQQLGLKGVLVLRAPQGSPAASAGVKGTVRLPDGTLAWGDVITGVDTAEISTAADLYRALDEAKPGQKVKLRLLRITGSDDGQQTAREVELVVTLGAKVTQFERT